MDEEISLDDIDALDIDQQTDKPFSAASDANQHVNPASPQAERDIDETELYHDGLNIENKPRIDSLDGDDLLIDEN